MTTSDSAWRLAGVLTGAAGLATSYLAANLMSIRESPVVAVAELVIRLVPGDVADLAVDLLGRRDKLVLLVGILVVLAVVFALLGRHARQRWWVAAAGFAVLAVLGSVAVLAKTGAGLAELTPVGIGLVTWYLVLSVLTERLHAIDRAAAEEAPEVDVPAGTAEVAVPTGPARGERAQSRRGFLVAAGVVAGVSAALAAVGRIAGSGRRKVEETRRLLRLAGVSSPTVPPAARIGVEGVAPWMTPAESFYLIDTAVIVPTIEPTEWTVRIHGMVENEIEISYETLVAREITERWITLSCVSNEIGGDLVGNAWWSGVLLADLLALAGPDPEADAVLQTSEDGWTCGTPLETLTDDRGAMLAVAMNGKPLPIEHGFPVRTIVPGLYGYVSACKWVVDLEVTKFSDITAFWTDKGWAERGPAKIASRIDVPRSGDEVPAGSVTMAGVAWHQHTGISAVEVSVDNGPWTLAELAGAPNDDTWVQWRADVEVDEGDHVVRVRATGKDGEVQTGVERDVLPDGATGWHHVEFSATA